MEGVGEFIGKGPLIRRFEISSLGVGSFGPRVVTRHECHQVGRDAP